MTARPSSAGDPPDAMSWLSWYWANRASASRWAWSNARRWSPSSAAIRGSEALDLRGPGSLPARRRIRHRSAIARRRTKHETAPGSRWPIDRSPSRSARPRRAMSGRVERIPARPARKGRSLGHRPGAPAGDRRSERFGRRAERVEDRLVADGAAPSPGKSRGRDNEHLSRPAVARATPRRRLGIRPR